MNQNQIELGDQVTTPVGAGVVIHPKDNPEDNDWSVYSDSSPFVHVKLNTPFSQPALHGETFTTVYAVQRRTDIQLISKASQ